MKRLIILSWLCILAGIALSIPNSMSQADASPLLFVIANIFLILPQVIWLWTSNRIASKTLGKRPSKTVNILTLIIPVSALITFALFAVALSIPLNEQNGSSYMQAVEIVAPISFLTMFIALISASILVSKRIIDTEDDPQAGRKSRIFVLCICFFYILIGMFFISPRLKVNKAKAI